jgi:uncharacterized repeat protein (TIGR03803 family)
MHRKALLVAANVALAAVTMMQVISAHATPQEKVIHSFTGGTLDGAQPEAGLVFDKGADGVASLYGATAFGGTVQCSGGCGIVFQLTPLEGGGWTESVIYTFHGGQDGFRPFTSLTPDKWGNLYGTTLEGGDFGLGVVFKLTRSSSGAWTQSTLHSFSGIDDGNEPYGTLIFDSLGNLYGTTYAGGGGTDNAGVVFELSPTAGGAWTESILHIFTNGSDGGFPNSGVTLDAAGNVYGTTTTGGTYGQGVVFELIHRKGPSWPEFVLHDFTPSADDGVMPSSGVVFDAAGNLYGMTRSGTGRGYGTVFELTPTPNRGWTESVLYSFTGGDDGRWPTGGVIFDQAGNLYGTTVAGGPYVAGVVFELTPTAGGFWTQSVLHAFGDNGQDGVTPQAGLVIDQAGDLYGTTVFGGSDQVGAVFEVRP